MILFSLFINRRIFLCSSFQTTTRKPDNTIIRTSSSLLRDTSGYYRKYNRRTIQTQNNDGGGYYYHLPCRRQVSSSLSSSSPNQQQQQDTASLQSRTTLVPDIVFEHELVVKKSRFVALARHVQSWKEAQSFIQQARGQHPKARHWCTAYRGLTTTGSVVTERCDDDGEPSGTAGQPILNALATEGDLIDVVCVVVRYFGGIKLGAGGLIRAYGGAAREVLRTAERRTVVPTSSVQARNIEAQYVGAVYDCVSKCGGTPSEETYNEDGTLTLLITCQHDQLEALQSNLLDSTRGSIVFLEGEDVDDDEEEKAE
jgi:uncharacterized YigZ family protein